MKYSSAPEAIEIEIEAIEGGPVAGILGDDSASRQEAIVRVVDRGIGIDEETSAHAFELFFRTKEATRIASGAGIGLFVCRQLIEAMGGRTWLRPRDGGGTEAGFALPLTVVGSDDGAARGG